MGKFDDKLDSSGDPHIIAKTSIGVWLSEFVLEYSRPPAS